MNDDKSTGFDQQAENMYYALKFSDYTIYTILFAGAIAAVVQFVIICAFIYSFIRSFILFPVMRFNLLINIIMVSSSIILGGFLGYCQGYIRYREITDNPNKFAEIQKCSLWPLNLRTLFVNSAFNINTILFHYSAWIILLVISLFIMIRFEVGAPAIMIITTGGPVYALTDHFLWKKYFKNKILNMLGVKTYIDID